MQEYNLWTSRTFFPKKQSPKKADVPKKTEPRIPTVPSRFPVTHKHNFRKNVCLNCGIKKRFPIQAGKIKSPSSPAKFSLYKVASPKRGKNLSASAVEFISQVKYIPSPKKGKKLSASAVEFVPRF